MTVLLVAVFAVHASGFASQKDGYVEANVLKVIGKTIIIGNNCTVIAAETSPERAYSILLGMEGTINERPNTHDSFVQTLKSFNISVERVNLNSFDGRFYYSDIVLRNNKKQLMLDIMPSDAIAIALRANAPIYINKTFLRESGQTVC